MKNNIQKKEVAGLEVIEIPGDTDGMTIMLFHGFGANAMNLVPLSAVFRQRPRPTWLFPNAPSEIPAMSGYDSREWFPIDIEALQSASKKDDFAAIANAFPAELVDIRQHVERLVGELDIPRSRLILGGFSQGATLAVETVLHGTQRVAALLIFSGTLICEPSWRRLSHLHAKTPFFQSHGVDDSVLPLSKAKDLEKLLQEGGLQGKLHAFKGGHEIPQQVLIHLNTFFSNLAFC